MKYKSKVLNRIARKRELAKEYLKDLTAGANLDGIPMQEYVKRRLAHEENTEDVLAFYEKVEKELDEHNEKLAQEEGKI